LFSFFVIDQELCRLPAPMNSFAVRVHRRTVDQSGHGLEHILENSRFTDGKVGPSTQVDRSIRNNEFADSIE